MPAPFTNDPGGEPAAQRGEPEVVITPYRDGPLLVRGPVRIRDQAGEEIVVRREVVALCRCGKSRTRPLCDGTHKLIRFRAPSGLEDGFRGGPGQNGSPPAVAASGSAPAQPAPGARGRNGSAA